MATADGLLSALSWPQRQLKETVSGDEHEWFSPDGLPPWAYAAGNTALDLVADPLNLLPVGPLAKAGKAVGDAKGMLIGAAPNFIKNFYGPSDALTRPVERIAAAGAAKAGADMPKAQAAGGMAQWGADSAWEALQNLVSPTRRALYKEQGVNPGTQRFVRENLERGGRRDLEKAHANINYMNHIQQQAGRTGPVHPSVAEVAHRSNLETYTPNEPGTIAGWMQKNAGTEATGEAVELSDNAANYIERHVSNSWGPSETVVMKRARSGTGGNHFNDMYRGKLLPVTQLSKAFQKHDDIRDVYKYLVDNQKGAKYKVKTKDYKDLEENGLWIYGSGAGSAVTEGGVNWLTKVEPDGTLMSVISDKHDFLEKLPVVGKAAEKALPNDLIAVTPPMFANIKNIRKTQFEKAGHAAPTRSVSGVQRKKQPKESTNLMLLEEFLSAKPSEQAVKSERLRQAGMLTTPLPIASKVQEDE